MSKSYLKIDHELSDGIRLLMTDIDGTITDSGGNVEPVAADAVRALMQAGIIVGFVTGRTLPRLESPALDIASTADNRRERRHRKIEAGRQAAGAGIFACAGAQGFG